MIDNRALRSIRKENLEVTTVRDFSGAWNVIDSEFTLKSSYARIFRNVKRRRDASVQVRYGSEYFSTIQNAGGGDIVNCTYFSGMLIVVDENGYVFSLTGNGTVTRIFDPVIAFAQPGAPNGWSPGDYASFARMRGDLTIHNGLDKPLIVDRFGNCSYLRDLATGSNLNTPIGKYAQSVGDFLLIGGDPLDEDLLHISNQGTSGTWLGDDAPNNAVQVALSGYVASGSPAISGLINFRDKALISFDETILIGTVGQFNDDGDHVPTFDDAIEQFGTVSHHAIQNLGDDVLFTDISGVGSVNRSVLNDTIRPNKLSYLVDPEIQSAVGKLSPAVQRDHIYSVYDRLEGDYYLFVPLSNLPTRAKKHRGFVYTSIPRLKINCWSEHTGRSYHSACRSAEGRIFVTEGPNILRLGSDMEPIYGDLKGYAETFGDNTQFTDGTGWTPATSGSAGLLIDWEWEVPWSDFAERRRLKHSKYLNIETEGEAPFTVSMFVDRLYENNPGIGEGFSDGTFFDDGAGWVPKRDRELTPVLSAEFIGGDAGGLGLGRVGSSPLGVVRHTADERLFSWPARFNIMKLRFSGATNQKLRITSFTFGWLMGGIRR